MTEKKILTKSKKRKERKKKQKVKLSDDVNVAAEEAVQDLMDPKEQIMSA